MFSVIFGVGAALGFGSSDFLGGLASRQIGSIRTVWVTALTALLALFLSSFILVGTPSADAWLFGGLSGIAGVLALVCLYASLAIGPMSILSPIGAVVGAVVPTVWDILIGESLPWYAYLAIVLALVAVAIVGFTPGEQSHKPNVKGLTLSLTAGLLFGVYYVFLDMAPDDAGLWPLIANRTVSVAIMTVAVLVTVVIHRARRRALGNAGPHESADFAAGDVGKIHWRVGLQFALIAGVLEAFSTSMYLYGVVSGSLTVVSVLTSLYPAGTIILATLVLNERLGRVQVVGLVLAVIAAAGLALA